MGQDQVSEMEAFSVSIPQPLQMFHGNHSKTEDVNEYDHAQNVMC